MIALIVFAKEDGSLSLVMPTGEVDLDTVIATAVPQGAEFRLIGEGELALDDPYFDAFRMAADGFTTDMTAAREILREKIRGARKPLMAALDVDYQRADEDDDAAAKARVRPAKQALRRATDDPAIEAAQDLAALRAVWPECLGARPEG